MQNNDKKYKELRIMSTDLLIPRNTYQRELNTDRVHKIVKLLMRLLADPETATLLKALLGDK